MKMKGGRQMKKLKSRTNKGITLIALVIAIILEDGTAYYTEDLEELNNFSTETLPELTPIVS